MNKKTIIIIAIVCAILLALAVGFGIYLLNNSHNNNGSTENTQVGEGGNTAPTDEDKTINGIPSELFNATSGRAFTFELKNTKSGEVFTITPTTTFSQITYEFYRDRIEHDVEHEHEGKDDPTVPDVTIETESYARPDIIVDAGKTSLIVEATDDKPSGLFTFGVANESEEKLKFDDSRLVYIAYEGNGDWKLCGIATNMTQEQVVEVLGEPTQAMKTRVGYSMEWYVLVDGHTYFINVLFDVESKEMTKIVLSVDNFAMY